MLFGAVSVVLVSAEGVDSGVSRVELVSRFVAFVETLLERLAPGSVLEFLASVFIPFWKDSVADKVSQEGEALSLILACELPKADRSAIESVASEDTLAKLAF